MVGDSGISEGLLVRLGLGVRPEQDGDLARRDASGDKVADAAGGAFGLGRLVGVLGVAGLGSRVALGDQFQAVFRGTASGLGEQAVGEVDDLGVER